MKRPVRCWRCAALGLLTSALLHAAAAGWWLSHRDTSGSPPLDHLETQLLALDLAAFGPPPGVTTTETPEDPDRGSEPTAIASAPVQKPEPLPDPEPPLPAPHERTAQRDPTAPRASPEPTTPRPESAPRPQDKRPLQPASRPKPPPQRPQTRSQKSKKAQQAPPESPRRTQAMEADRPGVGPQTAGAGSTDPKTTGAPGGSGATGSTAKAEASYLAELQRAIARHQRFPDDARRRNKTGTATLSFLVQGDGSIRQVRVAKSSGDANLDAAAVEAMQRLNRFKPIPPTIGRQSWSLRVPIRFDLR